MRVLIIEDDPSIADGIADALSGAALETAIAHTGTDGLRLYDEFDAELVVLDLGLPDLDGTEVVKELRLRGTVPIIVVSARGDEVDRVLALELGADDYLVKPFGLRELLARIRAIARRTAVVPGDPDPESPRHVGPLTLDRRTRRVTVDEQEIHLTPTEFDLVEYLSADPGTVHRRSDILRDVWKTEWYGATKTLDAHVAAIRRKLGDPGWVQSVRGVGFRFEPPT